MLRISPAAALAVGMPSTPLAQTVADVRAWDRERGEPVLVNGMTADEERTALGLAVSKAEAPARADSRRPATGWEAAGVAWSDRAVDWAYLMEPLFAPVYRALVEALALEPTDALLDIGCGSGGALQEFSRHCSQVAGIDAADGLLSIARLRLPQADLRHGSLTELPWSDGAFDVVTGINSFVYADDGGLS